MGSLFRNIQVGLRGLRRAPGFAFTAILTLGLGIGLSTAVFTVSNTLLLRRLPVGDQSRLVVLGGLASEESFNYPVSFEDGREFAGRARSFTNSGMYLYNGATPVPIRVGDQVSHLHRALVSGTFFDALGANAAMGRSLVATDDVPGAEPVLVLSHTAWREQFGADPDILGQTVVMYGDGVPYTVVGVMPQGLDFPKGVDFWTPITSSLTPATLSLMAFYVIGRLRPGASAADAAMELTNFYHRPEASTWEHGLRGVATDWSQLVLGDVRPALLAIAAAAGLLLLIACIDVANLLLVRGLTRMRELAVRSALGANRSAITTQLLTENALLAIAGGLLGLIIAIVSLRAFVSFAPAGLPRLDEIRLDTGAVAGAAAITAIAMMLFALGPAFATGRIHLQEALRSGNRQSASKRSRLGSEALVAGQVALALLVLSAAGIIGKSLVKLQQVEYSFNPSQLLIGKLAIRQDLFEDPNQQRIMLERLVSRLEAIPGVSDVTPVVAVPFSGAGGWDGKPAAEGQSPEEAATNPMLNMEVVEPNYFETFDIPILGGRPFTDQDREGTTAVVVVSRSTANHYWPGLDPVGKRLLMGADLAEVVTVIGVVPDTRYRDLRTARPSIYFPLRQSTFPFAPTTIVIKTGVPPIGLITPVREAISATEPGVALASAAPFESYLEEPLAQPKLNALLLGMFAGAAVLLAAVGVFGAMAASVRQRRREFGIRLALGATPSEIQQMVLRRGLAIGAIGLTVGLSASLLTNRLLGALLFGVSPTDLVTLASAAAGMIIVAALASAIPARSTTRLDPLLTLRAE